MLTISATNVRQALLSLYVPTELANCDLAWQIPEVSAIDDVIQRAQCLRGRLLDAVEQMRPAGPGTPLARSSGATSARAYDCLRLRYVSGLDVEEVARQLAVGGRQIYRDLRWAEEQIAQLLSSRTPTLSGISASSSGDAVTHPAGTDALGEEIRALSSKPEPVLLAEVVQSAIEIVSGLASRQGHALRLVVPEPQTMVACTPAVLRQVLTLILSAMLQAGRTSPEVDIRIEQTADAATIAVPVDSETATCARIQAALQIADAQHWLHEAIEGEDGRALVLQLPLAKRRHVLVIEDNPGAYALYERYLSTSEWEPILAAHPRLAVDLAADRQVEAVVLDLMMAETDGWSLLQALRLNPRTQDIPVVVCSVINDPELGLGLGAAACLSKPVSRLALLKALRQAVRQRK